MIKAIGQTGLNFIANKFKELKALVEKKVDKIDGKQLSTNDYDNQAKTKVDAIPSNPKYTDTTYSNATTSSSGLMSAEDKSKLNRIPKLTLSPEVFTAPTIGSRSSGITFFKYGNLCILNIASYSNYTNNYSNEIQYPSGCKPSYVYNNKDIYGALSVFNMREEFVKGGVVRLMNHALFIQVRDVPSTETIARGSLVYFTD